MIDIRRGGLDDPRVVVLLKKHAEINRDVSPPESCHVFDLSRLKAEDVMFWSAWDGETLLGFGALKRLDETHGEVKSMHTAENARGQGVGSAILETIVAAAKAGGMTQISLETGSMDYFAPARALYARHMFEECLPFGCYSLDPNSIYMTRRIG